ncbi:hypothetical protein BHF70_00700 [Anaerostipes sp. 494a]|uniref:hypothetical protein n=1 Tax=Anaerostipes sp. 494a TaxID=1261636 RepID=UPI000950DE6D|nr:hypothetical protein [Anaerostipes sp. 494a]OLR58271.1 hypothetical protein BHF70_00700 [Anaerostipes sp. 494a]
MRNPCKTCAEPICMGICKDKVRYREYLNRIRWQIIELNRRGERGQERIDPILRYEAENQNN